MSRSLSEAFELFSARVLPGKPPVAKPAASAVKVDSAEDLETKINALKWQAHEMKQRLDAADRPDPLHPQNPLQWNPHDRERNAARQAAAIAAGGLHMVIDHDGAGRPIRSIYGDIGAMLDLSRNPRQYVTGFPAIAGRR